MNDIMQVNNISKTMSSREMAVLCKKRHDNTLLVIRDLENRGLLENSRPQYYTHAQNGQQYIEYISDKRDSLVIVARLSPEFMAAVIDRWQVLEAGASQPVIAMPDFTNPAEAARAFADQYEAKQIAQEQLAIAQPKADALDFISTAVNSLNARDTAKTLGIQPQKFNKWCIAHNWMYRDSKDKLQMCSNRLQQGFMEQRSVTYLDSNNNVKATTQPLFTAKGLTRLASIFSIVHEVA